MENYILVTGGLGFIGSHIVVQLLNQNFQIIILDNLSNCDIRTLSTIKSLTGKCPLFFNFNVQDKSNLNIIFDNHKINSVIHLAGLKYISDSIKEPLLYYENNIIGTLNLLQVMISHGVKRIIFSSSATVYGNNDFPVNEMSDIGIGITNPYGQTKYMVEQILRDLLKSDPSWSIIVLRYFNPIGNHPSGLIGENITKNRNNLFPLILRSVTKIEPKLLIYGNTYNTPDGTCVRDFIHVDDVSSGHIQAIAKLSIPGIHIYNLGTGQGTSILQLIQTWESVTNIKINYEFTMNRPGDIPIIYSDSTKAKTELQWSPKFTIDDACRHAYKFIKNYYL